MPTPASSRPSTRPRSMSTSTGLRAELVGVSERDVAENLQDTLAGSIQTRAHLLAQSEERRVVSDRGPDAAILGENSLSTLENIPASVGSDKQIIGGVASIKRGVSDAVVSHYAVQPVVDIFATNNQRDLGAVSAEIQKILDDAQKDAPKGSTIVIRGATQTMTYAYRSAFHRHRARHRSHLSADRREFSVVDRSVRDRQRAPDGAWPVLSGCCSSPARRCRSRR